MVHWAQQSTKPAVWEKKPSANDLAMFPSPQKTKFAHTELRCARRKRRNQCTQTTKYRDTNLCWVKDGEEKIGFLIVTQESSPLLSKTSSGYWWHLYDGSVEGKQIIKGKLEDVFLELNKAPMNGDGKGM